MEKGSNGIEEFWLRYRRSLLWIAILLMVFASAYRLNNEFQRLLFDQSENGAIDLKYRHDEVHRWFSGLPVYQSEHAIYPPASYMMLWPFLGWVTQDQARWLWAITTVAAMIWLMYLLVKHSHAQDLQQRLFVTLLVPSIYATGAAIGNGQLIVHLLPFLITALVMNQKEQTWSNHFLIATCFLAALMKPAIAVPFFFILLFYPPGVRAALLICTCYLLLTLLAILPQKADPGVLISDWLARGSAAALRGGYANLHSWLNALHFEQWILPASVLLLAALGIWIFKFRNIDLWISMGVTAYFARFWIYHRLYDDFLLLIPMISLFRISVTNSTTSLRVWSGVILAITWAAALAPARLLSFSFPYNIGFEIVQTTTWMMGLTFLIYVAKRAELQN